MHGIMKVVYKQKDGVIVTTMAYYSYRKGPIGEWMVGNIPLSKIKETSEIMSLGESKDVKISLD